MRDRRADAAESAARQLLRLQRVRVRAALHLYGEPYHRRSEPRLRARQTPLAAGMMPPHLARWAHHLEAVALGLPAPSVEGRVMDAHHAAGGANAARLLGERDRTLAAAMQLFVRGHGGTPLCASTQPRCNRLAPTTSETSTRRYYSEMRHPRRPPGPPSPSPQRRRAPSSTRGPGCSAGTRRPRRAPRCRGSPLCAARHPCRCRS